MINQRKEKIVLFEYFVHNILCKVDIDLNMIKINRLLFLTVCANIERESEISLLSIFDSFHAWPYGPVEQDIYQAEKTDSLEYFTITNKELSVKRQDFDFLDLDKKLIDELHSSINYLLLKNPKILQTSTSALAEITMMYNSWKKTYSIARIKGTFNEKINDSDLIPDQKYFMLNPFELI